MHAILGAVKALLFCWINRKYADLRFYIGKVAKVINSFKGNGATGAILKPLSLSKPLTLL